MTGATKPWQTAGRDPRITRVRIDGTTHRSLGDIDFWFTGPARRWATATDHGAQRQIDLTNELVGGFLDRRLKGEENGFPEQLVDSFPEIVAYDYSWLSQWWSNRKR